MMKYVQIDVRATGVGPQSFTDDTAPGEPYDMLIHTVTLPLLDSDAKVWVHVTESPR